MNAQEKIYSPITGNDRVKLVKQLHKTVITRDYQAKLKIDVARFYDSADDKLNIFECKDTGFKFYHPPSLAGDGEFYDSIIFGHDYYSAWKKEYEFGKQIVQNENAKRVLDVGCGSGQFIKSLAKTTEITGLEMSDAAAKIGRENGLDIRNEPIEAHALSNRESYDVVCAFQVLEHVPNARNFLQELLDCVRPGGSLVLSVPNCEPYYSRNHWYGIANLPPHHMGLWNLEVFEKLENYFPIQMQTSDFDSKQKTHSLCLQCSLSQVKHSFPGIKNEKLIRAFAILLAAFQYPWHSIRNLGTSRFGRVMVHFKKINE